MTPDVALVLDELRRHGVTAYRPDSDHVRLIPKKSVTPELLALVRRVKPALLPLLPPVIDYEASYAAVTVDAGTAEDLDAIGHHVDLNGFWVAQEITWLDHRLDRLARAGIDEPTYRAAVLLLVARVDELRRWAEGTAPASGRRRLTIDVNAPVAGPVQLPDGTTVEDVGRFIGRLLTAVGYVLGRTVTAGAAVLEIYLGQLATLGIAARVEVLA